jgi:uncharacterized protein YggT (Ycf19 family)
VIDQAFFADWYFHIPNYILAAVMYSLIGRFLLSFFFPAGSTNPIFRAFVWITEPAVRVARFLTPAIVPHMAVLIFAVLWTMLLRFGLLVAFADGLTSVATG